MIDLNKDIHSLSHFKRKTAACLARLKKSGHPLVLTVNGKAKIVVQDTGSYQRLRELADRAEMIDLLNQSLADIEAGRSQPMRRAIEALGRKKT